MGLRRIARILTWSGGVALAILLGISIWVVRHRDDARTMQHLAGLAPGTLLHAHKFHWTQMKDNHQQWVLTASDASYSTDKTSINLTNALLSMTNAEGKRLKVTAPRAELRVNGNHVRSAFLSGGITVDYGSFVLTTQQAAFHPGRDELDAPGKVKIVGEGLEVTGTGLVGHPKARNFALEAKVITHINPGAKGEKPSSM